MKSYKKKINSLSLSVKFKVFEETVVVLLCLPAPLDVNITESFGTIASKTSPEDGGGFTLLSSSLHPLQIMQIMKILNEKR